MKFSNATSRNGRMQMRERQRRDRATTPEMRVRFPQFSEMRFEFAFGDQGPFPPVPQVTVLHPPARAYFLFPCPHSDCSGEFDLSAAIATLAADNGETCDGQAQCSGHRYSVGKTQTPCTVVLKFKVVAHRS